MVKTTEKWNRQQRILNTIMEGSKQSMEEGKNKGKKERKNNGGK